MNTRFKRYLSLGLFVLAVLSALGGAALAGQRQARLRGTLNGLPEASLPPRVPVLGINVDLTQYNNVELAENLDLIANTGFVWVRQPVYRAQIETAPGTFDWAAYDRIFEAAHEQGLQIVAVLLDGPDQSAPPANLATWTTFVSNAADHWSDTVEVYQIWDEPNLSSGWGDQPPSPVDYAALLEASYTPIRQSGALVLTAGLAPTTETGPDNVSDVLYLQALYENGAAPFFDGVASKPYGFDEGPGTRKAHPNLLNFNRMVLLRDVMVSFGDGDKPLWASNFGWNSLPVDWEGQPSLWGQSSPDRQAAQTVAAYERALQEWPWAGALILDTWQPNTTSDDPRWGFALRGQNGDLSPTVEAIRERADAFNTMLWPGIYPAATDLAYYSGEWEFSELGADFSENNNSIVEVPFAGDSLAVTVRRDEYRAYLYVTVDGEQPSILPQDERGAYLVLTAPDYQPHIETLPIATGLEANVRHIAHIEAERGWDQWALVGYAVGNHVNTFGHEVGITALALLTVVFAMLAIRSGRGVRWHDLFARPMNWLTVKMGDTLHLGLSLAAALAVWAGAALTWGGLVPDVLRRLGDGPSLLITALTAGIFYYSPWFILTLIALATLFVLIYARPHSGLALMMFFTPYFLLPRPLFDRMFSMVEAISLLTLAAWAIHVIGQRKEKGWPTLRELWHSLTALDKAVGLFILVSTASVAWAQLKGVAVTELRQMVLEPFVMYLVLRSLPLRENERWQIVNLLVLTGFVVSVIGFYQMATGIDVITAEAGALRLKSVFGTPNNAALYLGRLVPITAGIAVMGTNKRRRWLYGIAGITMLAAAGLTLSKGSILLGIPAGLALVLILWQGRRGLFIVLGGIVAEGLALIPLSRHPRFAELFDFASETSTSLFRVQLWQSTLRMIRDHPLLGVGLDNFLYQYRGRYILPAAWRQPDLSQPHNFLLNYWARLGLIGLAAGIWMQVAFWQLAWRTQDTLKDTDADGRALAVGLMGSMAAMIAHGLVDEVHFVIDLAFIFFMTLGLMHQISTSNRQADNMVL